MKNTTRLIAAFAAAFTMFTGAASAQSWPTKPVRIIVPFGAGGAADVFARLVAAQLTPVLGQPVIIDNRPGGNFAIGTVAVTGAAPDGYTLLVATSSHTLLETLGVNRDKYQLMRDLTPVATMNYTQMLLVVHPSLPVNSVRELIALAKSKPGELNYASTGNGSILHLAGELFLSLTGTKMTHVPYKTGGTARNDLLAGRVPVMWGTLTDSAASVNAGQLRALGLTASRSNVAPGVPTIAEAGVPGYDVSVIVGLMAPAGTPKAVVDRLNQEVGRIIVQPEVKAAWDKMGSISLVTTPAEFGNMLNAEISKWDKVVKEANIKMD